MDDLAHLLLGCLIYRCMVLLGLRPGKLELAAVLAGSVAPDLLWASGLLPYPVAHVATYYVAAAVPLLLFARTRLAAFGFAVCATAHVLSDAPMHVGMWAPFYPLSFSITGSFNYWEQPLSIAAYWLALLLLLSLSFWLEKKKAAKPAPKSS